MHGLLVPHVQVLLLYQSPEMCQKLFFKIISCSAADAALFQNPRGLCCDSPPGACHQHHMAFFPSTDTCNTTRFAGLYGSSGRATAHMVAWTCYGTLMLWAPTKQEVFQVTQHITWIGILRCAVCCLQKPKRSVSYCASCSVVGDAKWDNVYFILEGISQHSPDYWTSRNITEVTGL